METGLSSRLRVIKPDAERPPVRQARNDSSAGVHPRGGVGGGLWDAAAWYLIRDGLYQSGIDRAEGVADLSRYHDVRVEEMAGVGAGGGREPAVHTAGAGAGDQLLRYG